MGCTTRFSFLWMFVLFEAACVVDRKWFALNVRIGSGYDLRNCNALMQNYVQNCVVKNVVNIIIIIIIIIANHHIANIEFGHMLTRPVSLF
jgi:hypothetical protein